MLQRWFRTIATSWLVVTWPVFFVINYFLYDHPLLAAILFWWLLPIFDRIPLHILSRVLFGEIVTIHSVLKAWPKILYPHFIKSLTIYRLDFARSYNLPVWQLEKLSGNARAQRAKVLQKMQISNATNLSLICLFMEIVLFISLFGLLMMIIPEYYADQMARALLDGDQLWWDGPLINLFVYITYLIIEPFFVAGGFSLYINRRTELEGWDIEIIFRQLAERIKEPARTAILVIGVCVMLELAAPFQLGVVHAQQPDQENISLQSAITNQSAKKSIQEIMATDEFQHKNKVAGWHLKDPSFAEEKEDNDFGFDLFNLKWLGDTLAFVGQILLWMAVPTLFLAAVYFYLKWMPEGAGKKRFRFNKDLPKSLFGLEITPESLPDDVAGTALALCDAGKVIEALGLLYRGALTTLVHRDGINLKGSATEGDCIRIVTQHTGEIAQPTRRFFQLLTRQWQFAAYAHRFPGGKVMEELCQSWNRHFGAMR